MIERDVARKRDAMCVYAHERVWNAIIVHFSESGLMEHRSRSNTNTKKQREEKKKKEKNNEKSTAAHSDTLESWRFHV